MSAFRLAFKPLKLSQRLYGTATPARMASVTEAKNVAPKAVSAAALHASGSLRNDWKREEIQAIFDSPLMDLLFYGVCSISLGFAKDQWTCFQLENFRGGNHHLIYFKNGACDHTSLFFSSTFIF